MLWQFSGDAPIYSQLIEQIKVGIVSGVFPPGERLPSVRDLATEAGVNPNTMQRALTELERDGLVYSQRTAGRFVTEDNTMINQAKRSPGGTAYYRLPGRHDPPGLPAGGGYQHAAAGDCGGRERRCQSCSVTA